VSFTTSTPSWLKMKKISQAFSFSQFCCGECFTTSYGSACPVTEQPKEITGLLTKALNLTKLIEKATGICIIKYIYIYTFSIISCINFHSSACEFFDTWIFWLDICRDDQILFNGILFYVSSKIIPGASYLPMWRLDGVILTALIHTGPVEFLYYWLHRLLHHHYLYSRYHSHHHSSIVTEPITCKSPSKHPPAPIYIWCWRFTSYLRISK